MITTKNRLVILALSIIVAVVAMIFGYGKIDSNKTESKKIENLENYFLGTLNYPSFERLSKGGEKQFEFTYSCNARTSACEPGDEQSAFDIFLKAIGCSPEEIMSLNRWTQSENIIRESCGEYDINIENLRKPKINTNVASVKINQH